MDMGSFEKAVAHMGEVFNQLSMTTIEAAEKVASILQKLFSSAGDEEKKKAKGISPKKYGMSQVNNSRPRSSVKGYGYIPIGRRNLPYQRRRF